MLPFICIAIFEIFLKNIFSKKIAFLFYISKKEYYT